MSDRPRAILRRTLDMLDIPRRYRSIDDAIPPNVAIRNVATDLAVVKQVASRIQERRDWYDKYDLERGWNGPPSYEANITRKEMELDCHLVMLGLLYPRLPKAPVGEATMTISSDRAKSSSILRSLRRPSLRSVKKAFQKPFKVWSPTSVARRAQRLAAGDEVQREDPCKRKTGPRPRANSCPQPAVHLHDLTNSVTVEDSKRIAEAKQPPSDSTPASLSPRRRVLSDGCIIPSIRSPVSSIEIVWHQNGVDAIPATTSPSRSFNKPISEITVEDVQATPPSVIVQRVTEELQRRREVKRVAAMAALVARERRSLRTGGGMPSVASSCVQVLMKATPMAFLAVVGAAFAVLSVVDMVLNFY